MVTEKAVVECSVEGDKRMARDGAKGPGVETLYPRRP